MRLRLAFASISRLHKAQLARKETRPYTTRGDNGRFTLLLESRLLAKHGAETEVEAKVTLCAIWEILNTL
jgi:hypothetical protein